MATSHNRGIALDVWGTLLIAVTAAGALSGVPLTMSTAALLLVASIVPPAVMLMMWRGAPSPTAAKAVRTVVRRAGLPRHRDAVARGRA